MDYDLEDIDKLRQKVVEQAVKNQEDNVKTLSVNLLKVLNDYEIDEQQQAFEQQLNNFLKVSIHASISANADMMNKISEL